MPTSLFLPLHAARHWSAPKPTLKLGKWGSNEVPQFPGDGLCVCPFGLHMTPGAEDRVTQIMSLPAGYRIILNLLSTGKAYHDLDLTGYSSNHCPPLWSYEASAVPYVWNTFLPSPTFPSKANVCFPDLLPNSGPRTMRKKWMTSGTKYVGNNWTSLSIFPFLLCKSIPFLKSL